MIDPPRIRPGRDHARGQEGLDLRAPQEPAIDLGVIERADPHAVTPQDERPVVPVPERNGELPPSPGEHPFAQVFIEVGPGLGVAPGLEPVPAREQFLAQFGILKQLAVERDPDRLILIADRLPAAGQVNDRQPPSSERHPRLDVDLLVVGPSVRNGPRHG